MAVLNRRLQILIDDDRFGRVEREAASAGISLGEFVRRLIDGALDAPERMNRQREALELLLSAPRMDVGSGEELRALIDESHITPELRC
ncbi:MAG: hypothetical protein WAO61_04945 [Solirubrobacterales bacterium]